MCIYHLGELVSKLVGQEQHELSVLIKVKSICFYSKREVIGKIEKGIKISIIASYLEQKYGVDQ